MLLQMIYFYIHHKCYDKVIYMKEDILHENVSRIPMKDISLVKIYLPLVDHNIRFDEVLIL